MRKVLIKDFIRAVFLNKDGKEFTSQNSNMSLTKKPGTGIWTDYQTPGYLIGWGLQSEDQASYTVGMIELEDGTITMRMPDDIKFCKPTHQDLLAMMKEASKPAKSN